MFGTVLVDHSRLAPEQEQAYKAVYCGLCRAIGKEYGIAAKMALSYDMTFLILLLDSLYEPQLTRGQKRCLVHPLRKREYRISRFTSYAAAMNTALAYYKALDDLQDDKNIFAWLFSRALLPAIKKIRRKYPDICQTIVDCLQDLTKLEKDNILDPDAAAACFGRLTGALFVPDSRDHWAGHLNKLGDSLGRFIYLSDALLDLRKDEKKGRYNPLKGMVKPGEEERFLPALEMTMGDCAKELEILPLEQDLGLLRNILYSGAWVTYHRSKKKEKGSDTLV